MRHEQAAWLYSILKGAHIGGLARLVELQFVNIMLYRVLSLLDCGYETPRAKSTFFAVDEPPTGAVA